MASDGGLGDVLRMLAALSDPRCAEHKLAMDALPSAQQQAVFIMLLLHVLSRGSEHEGVSVALRHLAGTICKNSVAIFAQGTASSSAVPQGPLIEALHGALLRSLQDPSLEIRKAAASLLGKVVDSYPHPYWAPIVPHLVGVLQLHCEDHTQGHIEALDGALTAVTFMCEDASEKLQMDASQPLNTIVPLLLGLMRHPHEPARHASLSALNSLVPYESSQAGPLYRHLPAFLQGLGGLAADASARIRRSVCQALVLLVATQAKALQPCFDEVCNFMLASVLDEEESVAIEACNFWLALLGEPMAHAALAAKLPVLVPHCVSRLRMTQAQVEREREEEEAMAQGSERIRWMRSKTQGGGDAESDHHFTVRKQCAFLLDQLSEAFPRAVLGIAGPCIQVLLQPQEAGPSWDREAGMLALGAIGYGCKAHLKDSISVIWPTLVASLADELQETRAMACWSLSRFSDWVDEQLVESEHGNEILHTLVQGLCRAMFDTQPRVQTAACSALSTLARSVAPECVQSLLEPIMQHTHEAWSRYGIKNKLLLMDLWSELSESCGAELGVRPDLTPLYLPHVTSFLQEHCQVLGTDDEPDDSALLVVPPLECLASLFVAVPQELAPIAPDSLRMAITLIETYHQQEHRQRQKQAKQPVAIDVHDDGDDDGQDEHTKDVVVSALDLLASMSEGLGQSFQLLLEAGEAGAVSIGDALAQNVLLCLQDPSLTVRTAAFSAVGELASKCPTLILPHSAGIMTAALDIMQLDHEDVGREDDELRSTQTNATWMAGMIAEALGPAAMPFIAKLLHALVELIHNLDRDRREEGCDKLRFNICVSLARFRAIDQAAVQAALPDIMNELYYNFQFLNQPVQCKETLLAWRALTEALVADPSLVLGSSSMQDGFMRAAERIGQLPESGALDVVRQIAESIQAQGGH